MLLSYFCHLSEFTQKYCENGNLLKSSMAKSEEFGAGMDNGGVVEQNTQTLI